MKKILPVMLLSGLLLTVLLGTLLAPPAPTDVRAQDDATPDPDAQLEEDVFKYDEPARVENGEADWQIKRSEFVNNYPDGFVFLGNAESSGGPLESVSILFSHTPISENDTRIRGEVDSETGELRVNVSGPDAWGIPPWLPINYRWRVTDESGTVYFSEWIVGEIYADNTRDWSRYENEDAIIYMQAGLPNNIAETILSFTAATHNQYVAHFGQELSFVPRVMLFNDFATFNEWRAPDLDTSRIVVGQASRNWGAIVQFDTAGDPVGLANTVVHEIAHLYQYDTYDGRAPAWWIEGQATFFEFEQDYDYRARVVNNAVRNNLPMLFTSAGAAAAVPPNTDDPLFIRWHYDVGYTFVQYLEMTYGNAVFLRLHELLAAPEDVPNFEILEFFAESIATAIGTDLQTLEREWRRSLGAPAERPTLIPTPTINMMFRATPTPFGQ